MLLTTYSSQTLEAILFKPWFEQSSYESRYGSSEEIRRIWYKVCYGWNSLKDGLS